MKYNLRNVVCASIMVSSIGLASVANAALISPVSVTANTEESSATNTIDGNFISQWYTAAFGGYPSDYFATAAPIPVLTFDLGADTALDGMSIWNPGTHPNGVTEFSLLFASEVDGLGGLGSSIAYNPTFNSLNITGQQDFSFSSLVTTRYVSMTFLDNGYSSANPGAGGDRVNLREVQFNTGSVSVPVPGSLLLIGVGLIGLAGIKRRKA